MDKHIKEISRLIGETRFTVPSKPESEIKKGSIVAYKEGYVRVTARFKDSVNLGGIFNDRIYHKRVPISEVREAHDEWYEQWTKSETYMSM